MSLLLAQTNLIMATALERSKKPVSPIAHQISLKIAAAALVPSLLLSACVPFAPVPPPPAVPLLAPVPLGPGPGGPGRF